MYSQKKIEHCYEFVIRKLDMEWGCENRKLGVVYMCGNPFI